MRPERFELPTLWFVAKCSIQLSYGRVKADNGNSNYNGNSLLDEIQREETFSKFSTALWQCSCLSAIAVNLSQGKQFLPASLPAPLLCFQSFGIGMVCARSTADEVARNGASLKINFGQRFSWAPLALSFFSILTGRLKPSPNLLSHPRSRQRHLFVNVQSCLP